MLENREAQREWKVESRSKFSRLRDGVMVKSERVLRALELIFVGLQRNKNRAPQELMSGLRI